MFNEFFILFTQQRAQTKRVSWLKEQSKFELWDAHKFSLRSWYV